MNRVFQRIIHQTWKDYDIPIHWQISQDEWKRLHPDWTYMYWTDDDILNFMREEFPWFLGTFVSFKYNIQRVDAARAFILYKYGGVYSDLDLKPVRSIEPILFIV